MFAVIGLLYLSGVAFTCYIIRYLKNTNNVRYEMAINQLRFLLVQENQSNEYYQFLNTPDKKAMIENEIKWSKIFIFGWMYFLWPHFWYVVLKGKS